MIPDGAVDNSRMNIADFLEARIAEDEVQLLEWDRSSPFAIERLLAECAAKRAIMRYSPDKTLRYLASAYKDHAEYQQDWAP